MLLSATHCSTPWSWTGLCTAMVSVAGVMGFLNSLGNNLFIHKLYFCESIIISHFCDELPWLFPLSCPSVPLPKNSFSQGPVLFWGCWHFPWSSSPTPESCLPCWASTPLRARTKLFPTSLWCACSMGWLCSGTSALTQAQCWSEWSALSSVWSYPCWALSSTASRAGRWSCSAEGAEAPECARGSENAVYILLRKQKLSLEKKDYYRPRALGEITF